MRPGPESNRARLEQLGVEFFHGDIRCASDFEALPKVDWVIDAAANPSVLAGVDGRGSTRQLFEHNLAGLVNILEYCKTTLRRPPVVEQQPRLLHRGLGRSSA